MLVNDLYDIAERDNIDVDCIEMRNFECISMVVDGKCSIAIDPFKISCTSDEKVKLAHELGHCETGSFYNAYATCDVRGKHEHRADVWAIKSLIPRELLMQALRSGITQRYELAENFGVPESFMESALKYYFDKQ